MKESRMRRVGVAIIGAGVLALLLASAAAAHGGTVRVDNDYGPYHLIVVTGPAAQASDLLFTVVVTKQRGEEVEAPPIVGATVTATFQLTGGSAAPVVYPIPPEAVLADGGYYERTVTIPSDGAWQVTVAVAGPDGLVEASFPVTKRSPPVPVEWVTWATIVVPVLVVIGVFFYLWRVQRPVPAEESFDDEDEDDIPAK
jgi:hypothetical protein